jgi:hypothetical protein
MRGVSDFEDMLPLFHRQEDARVLREVLRKRAPE